MPFLRFAAALLTLILVFPALACAQNENTFPTNEEIALLLIQADRSIQQYKPLMDEQKDEIGNSVAGEIAKDRAEVSALEGVIKSFQKQPSAFNGPQGFTFLESLHGVERSLLQCVNTASSASNGYLIAGNQDKSEILLRLSESCMNVSLLIHMVGENAGTLYKRYVEAEDQWAAHNTQEARQCENALEKLRPRKFDPAY